MLFAGTTVIIALMGMFLLNITFLYGVAVAAALAVLFTMIAALTLLPAMLAWVGHRVNKWKIPGLSGGQNTVREDTMWYRWSRFIQRNPWPAAIVSGAFLLLLCVPDPLAAPRRQRRRHQPVGRQRRARPTTCSPKASARASTGR